MEKPREIKELLQLMLDNIDLMHAGLCGLNRKLKSLGIISYSESYIISSFFNNNLPKNPIIYSWNEYEKQPRIEWLKEQINKLK